MRRRVMGARRPGIALLAAVLTIVLTTGAAPANAGQLLLSRTGAGWAGTLEGPLFTAATYVPGDGRSAELFVKNDSRSPAALDVELVDASGTPALLGALQLSADVTSGGSGQGSGHPINLSHGRQGRSATLVTTRSVPAGGVAKLQFRLSLPATSGNESMRGHASFAVRIVLGDSRVVLPGVPPGPTDGSDIRGPGNHHSGNYDPGQAISADQPPDTGSIADMPRTGAETTALVLLVAALLGAGAAAVLAARRKRKDRQ